MLESNLDDTDEVEPQFPLSVTEAISVYTLYSTFLEDVMLGVEEGISKSETPVQLRACIREAFPNFIADLRDFLAKHVHPEIMAETEAQIAEARKVQYP